jgi:hypothetical protein
MRPWDMMNPVMSEVLTEQEAYVLLRAYNGLMVSFRFAGAKDDLLQTLRSTAGDIAGAEGSPQAVWLRTGQQAEDAFSMHDLAEKIARLHPEQCAMIRGWIAGAQDFMPDGFEAPGAK